MTCTGTHTGVACVKKFCALRCELTEIDKIYIVIKKKIDSASQTRQKIQNKI